MTRPLSIAMVCYPALGGSGVIASELAVGLAARGHRVHVLATAFPDRASESFTDEGRMRAGGAKRSAHPDDPPPGAGQLRFEPIPVPASPVFEHGPYCVAVACRLVELARHERIDVIHLHYAVPHAASALLAAQVLGAAMPATVMTLHGTDVTRLAAHPGVHPVTAFAVAACGAITVPSQYLRTEAAERFTLPLERVQVIPNFVDLARFAPPARRTPAPDGPVLFHVSNFRPIKRPHELAEVLARVRRSVPARMILVGDGPARDAVEARAAALGVAGAMQFLGRRNDFAAELGHADGFVLTSESESFGVAALEAMATGVPVYGYRVGGLPEVVADAGALVPCGDVDALAAAIVAGLRAPAARDALGRTARARVEERFASERAIAAYEACYRRVSESRTLPPQES